MRRGSLRPSSAGPDLVPELLRPIPALVVDLPARASLAGIEGIRYVEPLRSRRLAFTPSDPLVSRQWYLTQSRFYEPWLTLPALERVPVAVIDSGVDAAHPELAGKILDSRSFVGGSAGVDTLGHGTFVAGLIAAGVGNGIGIAGLAPSSELLVAKVVTPSRAISDRGRGEGDPLGGRERGTGDQHEPRRHPRSARSRPGQLLAARSRRRRLRGLERSRRRRGRGQRRPGALEPVAVRELSRRRLPHVLGVSALSETGGVPKFSNRDKVYNDLAAPGDRILSIFPRPLTLALSRLCRAGLLELRAGGVSRGAGHLLRRSAGVRRRRAPPRPSAAAPPRAGDGDPRADRGRRQLRRPVVPPASRAATSTPAAAGSDVAAAIAALAGPLPLTDSYEANDDAGSRAYKLSGSNRQINAVVDFWDDQDDVYAIRLKKGQRAYVGLTGADVAADLSLALWLPQARTIANVRSLRFRARISARPAAREYFSHRASKAGWYFVQVRMSSPGVTRYRLTVVKG